MTDRIEAMQAAMQAKTGERVPIATAEAVLDEFDRLVGEPRVVVRGCSFETADSARRRFEDALALRVSRITPDDQTGAEVMAAARQLDRDAYAEVVG